MISLLSAAQRIRDQISEKSEAASSVASIESIIGQIPTSLETFAQIIVKDTRKREYLRALNPLAVSSVTGVADLTTLVETSGLLMDSPDCWDVRLSPDTAGSFQFFPEVSHLDLFRPSDNFFWSFSLEGEKMYLKDTNQNRDPSVDLTIGGFVKPVIADDAANSTLSARLEAEFVVYGAMDVMKFAPKPRASRVV